MKRKKSDFWQQMIVVNNIVFNMWIERPLQFLGVWNTNKNGIREFVLNSLLSNIVASESHGHGLPPIVRKVKDMIFNWNIICKKAWYKIHKIP